MSGNQGREYGSEEITREKYPVGTLFLALYQNTQGGASKFMVYEIEILDWSSCDRFVKWKRYATSHSPEVLMWSEVGDAPRSVKLLGRMPPIAQPFPPSAERITPLKTRTDIEDPPDLVLWGTEEANLVCKVVGSRRFRYFCAECLMILTAKEVGSKFEHRADSGGCAGRVTRIWTPNDTKPVGD